ncbi:Hypothetical_protein [Hexamita inflata]|uniref:Hypothetical_protein n=1 Tax=Hexamita inflata TaxID=28002 RepID=A0AA86QNV8_9EUKA|nr:Hypothetical protein HINF_LOCUS45097 [Hexamita inflata]
MELLIQVSNIISKTQFKKIDSSQRIFSGILQVEKLFGTTLFGTTRETVILLYLWKEMIQMLLFVVIRLTVLTTKEYTEKYRNLSKELYLSTGNNLFSGITINNYLKQVTSTLQKYFQVQQIGVTYLQELLIADQDGVLPIDDSKWYYVKIGSRNDF